MAVALSSDSVSLICLPCTWTSSSMLELATDRPNNAWRIRGIRFSRTAGTLAQRSPSAASPMRLTDRDTTRATRDRFSLLRAMQGVYTDVNITLKRLLLRTRTLQVRW